MMKNTTVGDYSPLKTQFGWHILQVEGASADVSDEYRRNMARQALYQRPAPQAKEDWLQAPWRGRLASGQAHKHLSTIYISCRINIDKNTTVKKRVYASACTLFCWL